MDSNHWRLGREIEGVPQGGTQAAPRKIRRTHIWFEREDGQFGVWYCPKCTKPLFKIQGRAATILPGDADDRELKMFKFPLIVLCRGKHVKYGKCDAEYVVEGFTD